MPMPKMPGIGWLEVVVVAQTVMPALLFIPALVPFRFFTRVASYVLPMAAWGAFYISGRRVAGGRPYPPATPLAIAMVWLTISAFANPWVNTFKSALCEVGITLGVLCPVFWAPASIKDARQIPRLLAILLLCNGASAVMGIAQVYRPDTFRPPHIAMFAANPDLEAAQTVENDDGRRFLRPAGLTDAPGGAAIGGQAACSIGLAFALAPGPWWWRGLSLALAAAGLAVLFLSQVRVLTLTLLLGLVFWAVLLTLRRDVKKLSLLLILAVVLSVGVLAWIVRSGNGGALKRFEALFDDKATTVFYRSRGGFIQVALTETLPAYPLGAGPGRAGMASNMFGDRLAPVDRQPMWAETQIEAWIIDGGLPMLALYGGALVVAFALASSMAIRFPDPAVAYWAGVVAVIGISIASVAFCAHAFLSQSGVQFWALFGALYGANQLARVKAARAAAER